MNYLNELGKTLENIDYKIAKSLLKQMIGANYEGKGLEEKREQIFINALKYLKCKDIEEFNSNELLAWLKAALISKVEQNNNIILLKNEIRDLYFEFWRGVDVSLEERDRILKEEKDREKRKEVWEIILPLVDELRPYFKQLIKERNRMARRIGYNNYSALIFNVNNLCGDSVIELGNNFLDKTNDRYFKEVNRVCKELGIHNLALWDIDYITSYISTINMDKSKTALKNLKDITTRFFDKFGIMYKECPIQLIYADIPYGGLCFNLKPRLSSVILVHPESTFDFYGILFHEITHALQNCYIGKDISYIEARNEADFIKEGTAELIRYFILEDEILSDIFQIDKTKVENIIKSLSKKHFLWLRRQAVDAISESILYMKGFDTALGEYNNLAKNIMGIEEGIQNIWISDPIFCTHPMYLYNYILAEYVRKGIKNYIKKNFNGLSQTGNFLKNTFFRYSGSKPWWKKVEHIWENKFLENILANESSNYIKGIYQILQRINIE